MRRSPQLVAATGAALGGLLVTVTAAQERLAVLTEPGTPVAATEILLTVGPADEEDAQAGVAYLSARSVIAGIRPALDSLGAQANVVPQKDALSFSVTAAPDVWEEATRLLARAIFHDPADADAVVRERSAIADELRARLTNPADAATRELDRAFFGVNHPWGRPTVGTPAAVGRLTFAQVDEFLRQNFTPDRAVAAVVGPVDEQDARAHLQPLLGPVGATPPGTRPYRPAQGPVRRDYNSVTTWVSASFRVPDTLNADADALRFVAYFVADALSFSPAQRSVYNVLGEVWPRIGGGEIRIQVVVPPEEADAWAERLQNAVDGLSTGRMLEDVFNGHLRRFRGERLMQLLSPEERAREAARQLLVEGQVIGLEPLVDELSQERVRAVAGALGPPTIVLLGPELDNA